MIPGLGPWQFKMNSLSLFVWQIVDEAHSLCICFAEKTSWKILFVDLMWEKNIIYLLKK
jgi:hypothetical protein